MPKADFSDPSRFETGVVCEDDKQAEWFGTASWWLTRVAWAAFIVTLPSAVWRVLMIVGLMPDTGALRAFELGSNHGEGYLYVFGLSVVQLGASFLTVGFCRAWGISVFERRVPRIPVLAVAVLGGLVVTALFTLQMPIAVLNGHRPDAYNVHGAALMLMVACYIPILAWRPLELLATYGYWRRTRRTPAPVRA